MKQRLLRYAAQKQNLRRPLDSGVRRNDDNDSPVIPGEQRETRNPGKGHWMPACAGMTKCFVSVDLLSAQCSGKLAMTALPKLNTIAP